VPLAVIRSPKVVLLVLTALNLLNYLDRYVLSAVLVAAQMDLKLSNFVAGLLPTVFLVGYFATSPVFGHLGDRGGRNRRPRLIASGVAIWSAATIGSGLASGAWSMAASRACVGVGEASYAALAPTIIDDFAPPERRGSWLSIFYAAIPVGSALGYLVGGRLMDAAGWRAAFLLVGAPGLACSLLCLLIADQRRDPSTATRPPVDWRNTLPALARHAGYRSSVLGYCAYTFAIGGFAYWAPKYVHTQYGLAPGRASVLLGAVTVVGGLLGTLFGGALADRLARRWVAKGAASGHNDEDAENAVIVRANLAVAVLASLVGAPLAAMAISAPTATGFFATVLPCQVALFLLTGPINVAILRSSPLASRASAMAVSIFAIHALGDLWSPPLMGLLADVAPMQVAMYMAPAVFAVAAAIWASALRSSVRLTSPARVR
jgi:MFS transporter, Spinster family, sphingosine-1-phosphate transporter